MPPDVALTIGEALHNPAGTSSQGLVRGIIRVFHPANSKRGSTRNAGMSRAGDSASIAAWGKGQGA